MGDSSKLAQLEKNLKSVLAKNIMTKAVLTVKEDLHLTELAAMMLEKRISGLPVVDADGKMTGVITQTDLFNLMFMLRSGDIVEEGEKAVSNPTVKFAMCVDVISIKEETTLAEIIDIMKGRDIHTLPVMKDNKLVGIIGRRDVLKHFYAVLNGVFGA